MDIHDEALQLAKTLADANQRVVFAESCTAGLVAAALAEVPGISEFLCGSSVVYRAATKVEWLGVSNTDLAQHTAVSEQVARQMAVGVLERTAEANLAASITGHLGPDAPPDSDGVVYIGIARRTEALPTILSVTRHDLKLGERIERQREAALLVLRSVRETLQDVKE